METYFDLYLYSIASLVVQQGCWKGAPPLVLNDIIGLSSDCLKCGSLLSFSNIPDCLPRCSSDLRSSPKKSERGEG